MTGDKTLDILQDIQGGHSIKSSSIKRGCSIRSSKTLLWPLSTRLKHGIKVFIKAQKTFKESIEGEEMRGEKSLDLLQDIQQGHSLYSSSTKRGISIENSNAIISCFSPSLRTAIKTFQEAQKVFQASIEIEIRR